MGADFNIKPVGSPVAAQFIRPAPEAARTAVATELPTEKSVAASDKSSATTSSASYDLMAATDQVAHQVIVDRAAAQVVYVTVDTTTNLVVNQYPEASRLRARAYIRAQDNAKLDQKTLPTDRTA
ncbi:hypothetical protein HNR60_002297 [Rhodopseudomonas rhenobacensis]|uniref:FlaG protein n=1 Tax=Rhodopseudomonas rhenobacensis TaxID=87461 RepID=A0A7W8DZ58_9BRAD|nr:hypothetical protein [Rhodopseudomonas rhenobacensis]MBB5047540.1 hypothetical protein [Rhodopseudomonas rhenobacensis]